MGKKRNAGNPQNHQTQSFGQMVSQAALAQLKPFIVDMVQQEVDQLSAKLTQQTANTIEMLYLRVLTLEDVAMEKLSITKDELAERVATREDLSEGLEAAAEAKVGDVIRMEIKTKTKDQPVFAGSSRLKVYSLGSGRTIGKELEDGIVGLKSGETKQIEFGKDKEVVAEVTINRVSRPILQPEAANANQA